MADPYLRNNIDRSWGFTSHLNIGPEIVTAGDLYGFLEKITKDFIDNIFTKGLYDISYSLVGKPYKYVLLGGKSINNVVSGSKLKKSFDFDIHLLSTNTNERYIYDFLNLLTTSMNRTLDTSPHNSLGILRQYLKYILFKNNLIDEDQFNHYNNETLFYYGFRQKSLRFSIKGLFIHLVFKNDLFQDGSLYSNGGTHTRIGVNEIYYPICDIDFESELNFGIEMPVTNSNLYTYTRFNINYAKLPILLYNLLKYIQYNCEGRSFYKGTNNLKKLVNLLDINNYNSWFVNNNNNVDIQFNSFYNDLQGNVALLELPLGINFTGDPLFGHYGFDENTTFLQIMERVKDDYLHGRTGKFVEIDARLLLEYTGINNSDNFNIFTNSTDVNNRNYVVNMETATRDLDLGENLIKQYTGILYSELNNYLKENKINSAIVDGEINRKVGVLSGLIDSFHDQIAGIKPYLKDDFFVYRIQNFECFDIQNGQLFNLPTLNKNDILHFPEYLSTSYSRYFNFTNFLLPITYILRIQINKNNRNWIFVNQYSDFPNEKEIILNKGLFFKVIDFSYVNVKYLNRSGQVEYRELPLITLKAFETIELALADIQSNPDEQIIGDQFASIPLDTQIENYDATQLITMNSGNCARAIGQIQTIQVKPRQAPRYDTESNTRARQEMLKLIEKRRQYGSGSNNKITIYNYFDKNTRKIYESDKNIIFDNSIIMTENIKLDDEKSFYDTYLENYCKNLKLISKIIKPQILTKSEENPNLLEELAKIKDDSEQVQIDNLRNKYLKYKKKYLELKKLIEMKNKK